MAQERNANVKLSDCDRELLISEMFTMSLKDKNGRDSD